MYTILAYAIPEESRQTITTAFDDCAKITFCHDQDRLFGEIKGMNMI